MSDFLLLWCTASPQYKCSPFAGAFGHWLFVYLSIPVHVVQSAAGFSDRDFDPPAERESSGEPPDGHQGEGSYPARPAAWSSDAETYPGKDELSLPIRLYLTHLSDDITYLSSMFKPLRNFYKFVGSASAAPRTSSAPTSWWRPIYWHWPWSIKPWST